MTPAATSVVRRSAKSGPTYRTWLLPAVIAGRSFPYANAVRNFTAIAGNWADAAIALRSLMSGQWKSKGGKPLLAVGKIVQAYDQSSAEQDLRSKTFWLRAINMVLPGLLLAGLGLAVFLVRRAQKRAFLASLG